MLTRRQWTGMLICAGLFSASLPWWSGVFTSVEQIRFSVEVLVLCGLMLVFVWQWRRFPRRVRAVLMRAVQILMWAVVVLGVPPISAWILWIMVTDPKMGAYPLWLRVGIFGGGTLAAVMLLLAGLRDLLRAWRDGRTR